MKKVKNINKVFGKMTLKLKKYSPEILMVAGVVGVVTSAVMACMSTTNLPEVLEKAKDDIDTVHKNSDNLEKSEQETNRELITVYAETGINLVKLYAPSVGLGAISIMSILAANNILRKRNIALASAYMTVNTGFREYRNRVVEQYGKEVDHKLRYDIKTKEVERKIVDEDTGEEKVENKIVDITSSDFEHSGFAKFFDETSMEWVRDAEVNLCFLRAQQQYANDLLVSRGYLFLNEVYDMLGIQKTKAGQVVGWIYDENNPIGDNFVDFGIYNTNRAKNRDFVNGYEQAILLDFNVDGPILELLTNLESV